MGGVPQVGLVVEAVELHAALARRAVFAGEMAEPSGDVRRSYLDAGVARIVAGHRCSVRSDPVAAVGPELICALLWAVFRHGEPARAVAGLGGPADERDGEDGVG